MSPPVSVRAVCFGLREPLERFSEAPQLNESKSLVSVPIIRHL